MIDLYGDSTCFGSITNGGLPRRSSIVPSDVVARVLGIPTRNFGIPGSTLEEALTLPIFPGGRTITEHLAISTMPVAVMNWGINDSFVVGVTPANQKARWELMRNICALTGKALIIQTPNPINFGQNAFIDEFNIAIKTIADVGFADTFGQVQGYYLDWPNAMDDAGVHPQERLYTWIGVRLARDLKRILGL